MASLIDLAQDAADEIGIPRPVAIIGSADGNARRLLAMSNREGRSLVEESDWTALQRLHTFTTVDSQEEYDLPSDYSRLLRDTEWDRSEQRPLFGPLNPAQWQSIKSGSLGSGLANRRYRIMRSASSTSRTFRVEPTPGALDAGETLAFEYVSNQWCSNAAGDTLRNKWSLDTDLSLLDDELMILGMIVRFKRAVGLEYGSEADEYNQMLRRKKGMDRPSPTLNLSRSSRSHLISTLNLPETGLG